MSPGYVLLTLVAMMLVTFALRALPFIGADWLRKSPLLGRLKDFLPLAIMTLLLLHSAAGAASAIAVAPWPVVAAVVATMAMQWRLRHPLLSIFCGTALFIVLCNGLG